MERIISWTTTRHLADIREFSTKRSGNVYQTEIQVIRQTRVHGITLRPGKQEMVIPLQELTISQLTMQELIERAQSLGVTIWRGNQAHCDILR